MGLGRTDYAERAKRYAGDVVAGIIPACKFVKAACQRHLDDLVRWPDGEYRFDATEANRVCRFAELLPHIKGEWAKRSERIKLEDWQCFILCNLFGWKQRNGLRRFRTGYIEVARANAKSTLAAVIGLLMFAADGEAGAEVYSAATSKDQAKVVWDTAWHMAKRELDFQEHFGVTVLAHNLIIPASASKFEALTAEDESLEGKRVHLGIVDEVHAHRTRKIWDVIESGTGGRSQPLILGITTAGSNRAGICYEQRSYVVKILNATLHAHDGMGYKIEGHAATDETYFGIIYTIDDEDDWTNEDVWIKANPNLHVSVPIEDLRRKCAKAMHMVAAQPNFLTKHLNQWVNADSAWMDMRAWEKAGDSRIRPEDFKGWKCIIGLDLASKIDICALMPVFFRSYVIKDENGKESERREYRIFGRFFLPEARIEDSDNSQYQGWVRAGYIHASPGNETDYGVIETELKWWTDNFNVHQVAFDPGFAWDFCQRMSNDALPMVEVKPSVMNYSEPMKELEAATIGQRIIHDANPSMSWQISNVVCHRDAKDNIYPRKEREENKIDGPVAAISAINLIQRIKIEPSPLSLTQGFITL